MKTYNKLLANSILGFLLGCSQQTTEKSAEQIRFEEANKIADALDADANASANEYMEAKKLVDRSGVLRKDIKPLNKKPPFFGIDTSLLTAKELAVLKSAGEDFQRIERGGYPTCAREPDIALADGGTLQYDCGSYTIVRSKSLSTENGVNGFIYGPGIDFMNGNTVSNFKFYTEQQMADFSKSSSGL